ncbi:MAG: orotidine 5'-phosphate decarboxylase [Candidatus Andersenbacteria bacterium RIFCSPHIGHO2_12_FULL_45_11b]|uniref:Orotidine-5'-phosphate decarboxylase n=1 Tax=Candidatus Andersenbacteria bacterium RIFCSPHIGHO2_12_FULL_45_11b TaxID=1797282 RepID=A0A1G1X590_9BACT|nr:MAG: orotidine 5'-phosphate decarboxylase [Candidatus Andersenbacteria bacterium RIFCSPHIGHO2_12_FULL_45_11b]
MATAKEMLYQRMIQHNTLLCCGLDPDLHRLPAEVFSQKGTDEEKTLQFLQGVVDVTAEHVCAYKVQKAFFDLLPGGHDVLKSIIAYTHTNYAGIPVIVDCKVGDIDNTMAAYIENILDAMGADGIVVNPYMGDDVLQPVAKLSDKLVVVLVRTSNPGSSIVQDALMIDGRALWQHILDLVVNRWSTNGNMVVVLSATAGMDLAAVRTTIPDNTPILLAGVGAQGGSYADLRSLLNSQKSGVFVNSSRAVLYPDNPIGIPWGEAIRNVAIELKAKLNEQRR